MDPQTGSTGKPSGTAYAYYVLFVLFLANCFNAADRAVISILVEPIKAEMGVSDTVMGLLTGFAFVLFYSLFGIPIARWADTGVRKNILALGIVVWSGMTALSAAAKGFTMLLLVRMGVGIGESTCFPTALSLITDYFPKEKRPRAIALFQAGLFFGIVLGTVVAGDIAATHGWRAAFLAMGLPGLLVALLVFATVREPVRGAQEKDGTMAVAAGGMRAALGTLLANRPFFLIVLGLSLITTASATLGSWGPALLMRVHGVGLSEVGRIAGPVIGAGGVIGTIMGGVLGSMLARRTGKDRSPLLVTLAGCAAAIPFMLLFVLGPSLQLAVFGGALGAFFVASYMGPCVAVALGLVAPNQRATASSVILIGQMLVGYGAGPFLVGVISDATSAGAGADSIRYGLLVAPFAIVAGWACILAAFRRIGDSGGNTLAGPMMA